MELNFKPDIPIYAQLIEGCKLAIASGELKPGEKLRGVRELAVWAGVNPNTMQRALSELEREGLLYTQRTTGRYVTDDEEVIKTVRRELAGEKLREFLSYMSSLGFTREEIAQLIKEGDKNGDT